MRARVTYPSLRKWPISMRMSMYKPCQSKRSTCDHEASIRFDTPGYRVCLQSGIASINRLALLDRLKHLDVDNFQRIYSEQITVKHCKVRELSYLERALRFLFEVLIGRPECMGLQRHQWSRSMFGAKHLAATCYAIDRGRNNPQRIRHRHRRIMVRGENHAPRDGPASR